MRVKAIEDSQRAGHHDICSAASGAAAWRGGHRNAQPHIVLTLRSANADILKPGFDLNACGERRFGGAKFDAPADVALDGAELVTELQQTPLCPGCRSFASGRIGLQNAVTRG